MKHYRKRILIFIDWFLPGYRAGGPIRSVANLTQQLSEDYYFYILTRNTDYLQTKPYPNINSNKWNQISENVNVFYFSKDYLKIVHIKSVIQYIDYDTVYITGIYSFYFSILPVYLFRKSQKMILVAPRGMLSKQTFSAKAVRKKAFIFFCNLIGFYKNAIFHLTNEQEKTQILYLIKSYKEIRIAPNLPAKKKISRKNKEKVKGKLKMLSIARISLEKNTLYALKILKDFTYNGIIIYDLYGEIYRQDYWQECKKIIDQLPDNIKVNYMGNIESNQVFSILSQYHFSFLPSKGENFGHSILESLMAGCPVIISDQTPWQKLATNRIGWDFSLDRTDKFAQTIQLCMDMEQVAYSELSEQAYLFGKNFSSDPELLVKSRKLFQ